MQGGLELIAITLIGRCYQCSGLTGQVVQSAVFRTSSSRSGSLNCLPRAPSGPPWCGFGSAFACFSWLRPWDHVLQPGSTARKGWRWKEAGKGWRCPGTSPLGPRATIQALKCCLSLGSRLFSRLGEGLRSERGAVGLFQPLVPPSTKHFSNRTQRCLSTSLPGQSVF